MLSQHVQRRYALKLLQGNPSGVGHLLKQRIADVDTFCRDLRRVCDGGTVLDPDVVAMMLARAKRDDAALEQFTARQREVLAAALPRRLGRSCPARTPHG